MKTFLGNVARSLWQRYGSEVSSLRLLVPNARSRVFFNEELASVVGRPVWEPSFVTVDELMYELASRERADEVKALVELYNIWKEYHTEDFDHFYHWGEMLLGDFDQIDKYLVDARRLLANLADLKELESNISYLDDGQREVVRRFWQAFGTQEEYSAEKRDFLSVWNTLYDIYIRFRESLESAGLATAGMAHRLAAEKIKAGAAFAPTTTSVPATASVTTSVVAPTTSPATSPTTTPAKGRYAVIGFNALTECEKVLFGHLREEDMADFFWDFDDYYIEDKAQEAGLFLRDNVKSYPVPEWFEPDVSNFGNRKNIVATSAGSDSLQCKYAATFLSELTVKEQAVGRDTAIVLTDENLLMPLLYSIPEQVDDINVTMGYPLKDALAYSFVERLLKLQGGVRTKDGATKFYHADVSGILAHPFVEAVDGAPAREIARKIVEKSKIVISPEELAAGRLSEKIFRAPGSPTQMVSYITEVLAEISARGNRPEAETGETNMSQADISRKKSSPDHSDSSQKTNSSDHSDPMQALDRECFALIADNLARLSNSVADSEQQMSIRTFSSLARRMLQRLRIPFSGEPLSGLQVMGILETRNLDFKNVMLLSMNDDNFPGNISAGTSFIPHNLRAAYGLPTARHHEGVWAYYFYRLLQRAENVHLVYCSRNDENSSGEQSRYIYQLEYESPHEIVRRNIATEVNFPQSEPITVSRQGRASEELDRFLDRSRSLSPSALNTYLDCRLKFYFKYLAGIEPEEEVLEQVDFPMLGTILHKAMEILYTPLRGAGDPRERIKALIGTPRVAEAVDEAIAMEFFHKESPSGNDLKKSMSEDKANIGAGGIATEEYTGNLLMARDVVIKYIDGAILPFDAGREEFRIVELEKPLGADFGFAVGDRQYCVRFYGMADRVDILSDGTASIVDYKTGSPHAAFAGVASLFEDSPSKRLPAVMQTFIYSMMARQMQLSGELAGHDSRQALYYVRTMNRSDYSPWLGKANSGDGDTNSGADGNGRANNFGGAENYSHYREEFEAFLYETLASMFDPATPFDQCADPKPCAYCDFNAICHR